MYSIAKRRSTNTKVPVFAVVDDTLYHPLPYRSGESCGFRDDSAGFRYGGRSWYKVGEK